MQTTLKRSLQFEGVGLHRGARARLTLRPAPAGHGVVFQRIDITDRDPLIPARHDAVRDTRLCTLLANEAGASVSTVEHLMAALAGLGVDNVLAEIDGPEIPILDGSALLFAREIMAVGLAELAAPRKVLRVLAPVSVEIDGATASLAPQRREGLDIAFSIAFPEPAIGAQSVALPIAPARFLRDLADCRTFVRRYEIEALRAQGLARGGSLSNAVVVDGAEVLNPGGLRRPDEFVRHKALDAVGDLALAGAAIHGRYEGARAGHGVTNALLRALFARPEAWTLDEVPALAVAAE